MSVYCSLFSFKEPGVGYIFLKILVLYNGIIKCFQGGSCPEQGKKKQQSIGIRSLYSNISYGFEYKKDCISQLSIIMFLKRKNKVLSPNILSLATSVIDHNTYKSTIINLVTKKSILVYLKAPYWVSYCSTYMPVT